MSTRFEVFLSEKAREQLNNAYSVYKQVQSTHIGLERYYLLTLLNTIAERTSILIAEQGAGKSAIGVSIAKLLRDNGYFETVFAPDKFSLSVFTNPMINKQVNEKDVLIFIDDYSAVGSDYAKTVLLSSIATLVYKKYFESAMFRVQFKIRVKKCSGILCIQPAWLNYLYNTSEFLGMIRDKSFRIYIMNRPISPNPNIPYPQITFNNNSLENIKVDLDTLRKYNLYKYAFKNIQVQNSKTRTLESLINLLKASAILNNRNAANLYDLWLIYKLTKLLRIEHFIKEEIVSTNVRYSINTQLLRIITMCITYKSFTVEKLAEEFGITIKHAYNVIESNKDLLVKTNSYSASEELQKIIRALL